MLIDLFSNEIRIVGCFQALIRIKDWFNVGALVEMCLWFFFFVFSWKLRNNIGQKLKETKFCLLLIKKVWNDDSVTTYFMEAHHFKSFTTFIKLKKKETQNIWWSRRRRKSRRRRRRRLWRSVEAWNDVGSLFIYTYYVIRCRERESIWMTSDENEEFRPWSLEMQELKVKIIGSVCFLLIYIYIYFIM